MTIAVNAHDTKAIKANAWSMETIHCVEVTFQTAEGSFEIKAYFRGIYGAHNAQAYAEAINSVKPIVMLAETEEDV